MHTKLSPLSNKRSRIWAAIALSVVMVLLASACETTDADEAAARQLVNNERARSGKRELVAHSDLMGQADGWAQEMRNSCTLKHRPNLAKGLPSGWTMVAENVATAGSIAGAHSALMNSSAHRNNILNGNYNYVGIGVVNGNCGGHHNVWMVQIFMRYTR